MADYAKERRAAVRFSDFTEYLSQAKKCTLPAFAAGSRTIKRR
jgi:hypothetical protein